MFIKLLSLLNLPTLKHKSDWSASLEFILIKQNSYSLNLLLWILVIAEDAIGLPIPELAGEPWDTGVMQYGEFWLAGESEVSLGILRPVSERQILNIIEYKYFFF